MKPKIRKWKRNVLLCAGSALLLAALAFAAAHETRQLAAGEKATVSITAISISKTEARDKRQTKGED
jgi:hypothetical protein